LAAAVRVYEVIDAPEVEEGGSVPLPVPVGGAVCCAGVTFGYRPDEPVLLDVDLVLDSRESVALVGGSGSGKTTLVSLLIRLQDPQQGRIQLDGIETRALRLSDLRRAVCLVEQDPFVFSGPLTDNLRYGRWAATGEELETAVMIAGLEPLIRSLPGGLRARLGERGHDLSGGQKQRVALARAILRDPALLLLDESFSALDSDAEAGIFDRLEQWLARRTAVVISHRLSTVSRFDRVVVLDQGRIVGDGPARALVETCPAFERLFAGQLDALGWSERSPGDLDRDSQPRPNRARSLPE
jgi:ATP-binding cassette subfamily B protein